MLNKWLVDYGQSEAEGDKEQGSLGNVLGGGSGGEQSPSYTLLHFVDKMEYNQISC